MEILQKLCNRLQYTKSADAEEHAHGITITIHIRKKKEKTGDQETQTSEHKLSSYQQVCSTKSQLSDDSDYEYVDANTLIPVPIPEPSDKIAYESSDSENEMKEIRAVKRKKKLEPEETLVSRTYKDIVKKTWTKGFDCPYENCDKKKFARYHQLRNHEKTNHLNHKIICTWPGCKKLYNTAESMRSHIKTTHRGIKSFQCDWLDPKTNTICGKWYRHKNGLGEHYRTHTGEKPWQCHGCEMKFHSRNTWRDHVKKYCPVLHNRKYRASNAKFTIVTDLAKKGDIQYDLQQINQQNNQNLPDVVNSHNIQTAAEFIQKTHDFQQFS